MILLFTGESGEQFGYLDGWEPEGTFRYFGEGQVGDMRFVAGNKAIRDHAQTSKDLHLFEILPRRQGVRYVGQMVCAGYEFVAAVPDVQGKPREAIAFRLLPFEAAVSDLKDADTAPDDARETNTLWSMSLEQLRARAEEGPMGATTPTQSVRTTYRRSAAVRIYVLRRANGFCEGCGAPAPFITPDGRPYLEPHHTRRLSDGGPDSPAHVIALCPTCHRRAHYALDSETFNDQLIRTLAGMGYSEVRPYVAPLLGR